MSDQHAQTTISMHPLSGDVAASHSDLLCRFRDHVQRNLAAQLAAGRSVYYCGTGADADRLFIHTPDDRRFEYRVQADGTRAIIRELAR